MRYWVYLKGEVPGSFEPEELAATTGFALTTLVCPAEGEILEKNWRRAGEFDDLVRAVEARAAEAAEPPPASAQAAPPPPGVDELLDQTGARLFSHVAGLMKELEAGREEKALAGALQRQVAALKEEVHGLRERAAAAEARLPRIAELEEKLAKAAADVDVLRDGMAKRDAELDEMRLAAEKARFDLEGARRKLQETTSDLAIRNRLVDKLSKDLAEKDVSLTKSLALIRRLEEDFDRLDAAAPEGPAPRIVPLSVEPVASPPESTPLPSTALTPPPRAAEPSEPFTADEPPAAPSYLEPPARASSGAQEALLKLLRKVFPGPHH